MRNTLHQIKSAKINFSITKKKFVPFCCLLLLFLSSPPAHGQAPGYMGKRLSLHYDPQFLYAFLEGYFDVHHNASLEYVTSQSHSVGFRYGFSNLKDSYAYEQGIVNPYSIYYEDVDVELRDKVHSFTAYVKFFSKRKGYIAPTGAYTALGMSFLHSKAVLEQDIYSDSTFYDEGDALQTDNNVAIYFGKGRHFIVGERIILNLAAHFGLPLIWRVGTDNDLNHRVAFSYFFRAQIGIGFLAF